MRFSSPSTAAKVNVTLALFTAATGVAKSSIEVRPASAASDAADLTTVLHAVCEQDGKFTAA